VASSESGETEPRSMVSVIYPSAPTINIMMPYSMFHRRLCAFLAAFGGLAFALAPARACAETIGTPVLAPGRVSILIQTLADQSANGCAPALVAFALAANPAESVSCWKLDIVDDFEVARHFSGKGEPPRSIVWDGSLENGAAAPSGSRYRAVLDVDFGGLYQPIRSTTRVFSLIRPAQVAPKGAAVATTASQVEPQESPAAPQSPASPSADGAPDAAIEFSTGSFTPGEDTKAAMLVARIVPRPGSSRIVSWTMTVYDPAGQAFASFEGSWPKDRVSWNGRNSSGEIVESCSDYSFVVTLKGERGSVGRASSTISTGVVLLPGRTKYNISVSSITFKPDTADFLEVGEEQYRRNQETLRLLARKLGQFPGYRIRIEGHAVSTQWSDPVKATVEERVELVPLSAARARAILSALAERGIDRRRMEAIGLGAKAQVVPDSDTKNRWKNRRVTFVLQRNTG